MLPRKHHKISNQLVFAFAILTAQTGSNERGFGNCDWAGPDQPADASAAAAQTVGEAEQLEVEDLASLMARYNARQGTEEKRPGTRILAVQSYERDPLIIAIARRRAGNKCEVGDCDHDPFRTREGVTYVEVHHIQPLSEGGEDTVENVACLCASHHREVHLGKNAEQITLYLRSLRAI